MSIPSLAQHFEFPKDHRAAFGWLCGYSSDAAFLDDALERFTDRTAALRADEGRPWLALMLDHRHRQISFKDAPGLVHLPISDPATRGFRLLHAKLALLGFRHTEDPGRWLLRLIVSTGNWTRQTLEQSLDLAWCIDLERTDLAAGGPAVELGCADLAAAWDLLQWIGARFDQSLLTAQTERHAAHQDQRDMQKWLARCKQAAGSALPRVFDNRREALFDQLVSRVQTHAGGVRRNYLAMGSGFYEPPPAGGTLPGVPFAIRARLREAGLLTASAGVELFVNPLGCQGVAAAIPDITQAGITVRPARAPVGLYGPNAARTLHAKFLFSANEREGADCSSPWVYLGSGNLTNAGFTEPAALASGNLEAGVVFAPGPIPWWAGDRDPGRPAVDTLLPVQWEIDYSSAGDATAGEGPPEREDEYLAAPIAWVTWQAREAGGALVANGPVVGECDVLGPDGEPCARKGDAFLWPGARPRQVPVRWPSAEGGSRQVQVPVIDELGRICATALPALDLDGARSQLAVFPYPPDMDTGDTDGSVQGDEDEGGNGGANRGQGTGPALVGTYPIRQMMALLEDIARRQTSIPEQDWTAWCTRLEQTLLQAATAPEVQCFAALGLNPLSPLRARPFRPAYAETADGAPGQHYEALLERIEQAWKVNNLASIGVAP